MSDNLSPTASNTRRTFIRRALRAALGGGAVAVALAEIAAPKGASACYTGWGTTQQRSIYCTYTPWIFCGNPVPGSGACCCAGHGCHTC